MSKKLSCLILVLAIAAFCLSVVSLVVAGRAGAQGEVQYVLYLGTNDKDSNEPVFAPEAAKAKVDEVLTGHFQGFTIQEANGGWVGDNGTVYHEYTLVIYLSDTSLEKVHAAADNLIKAFNQSSVLIQTNRSETEFYSGK